jgi:hypothetical protein
VAPMGGKRIIIMWLCLALKEIVPL